MDENELHEPNSVGDPMDEQDVNEVNYEITDEEEGPCYERKEELLHDCKRLTGSARKPLNVAIIGPPGCGKSSFLNTVFASLNSDRWYEYAKSGKFGNHEGVMGMQVTRRLRSLPKEEYYRQNDLCMLPTFIDMTGFENDDSVITEELLYLVFCGKVKEKEALNDIVTYGRLHGITTMKKKYRSWKRLPNRRINRIIIVCSSNPDSAMPTALLKTVVNVANELDITFYGVMTHADICREKYGNRVQEREKLFREYLGLPGNRLASVINYCPAVDPDRSYEDTLLPALDVPVLRLLRQILTPEPNDSVMHFEDCVTAVISTTKSLFYYGSRSFIMVDNRVKRFLFISSFYIVLFSIIFAFLYKFMRDL
ncbi:uncharacterized protein LOC127715659 [Mytilus californianus]|uniref:uncharacterized protein LOC127715659 n=1 Tax=Mytilus californianus TaxID=6549 RepID=UPI002246E60E|nr:uncharacterized protein LOC127715659 [Mytilus californianus]XP_052077782.1 uncharacterized protein LOC127715659 [Mytilus californianus]